MATNKRSYGSMSASEQRSSADSCSRSPDSDQHNDHITKSVLIEHQESFESTVMQCSLPPHAASQQFSSLEAFEVHYAKEHTNRCTSCGKNFPSTHVLTLHLDELHNPLREVLASKGEKTYACFVEDCDRKCSSPAKRRLHMIDKHGFPKVYNFRLVELGIDKTTSLLREGRKRRVSTATDPPSRHQRRISNTQNPEHSNIEIKPRLSDTEEHPDPVESESPSESVPDPVKGSRNVLGPDDSMEELETSLSALSFVPRSVSSRQARRK